MATITASLQNCSLSNHHQRGGTSRNNVGIAPPDEISDSSENVNNTNTNFNNNNNNNNPSNDATVELNSEIALPYHWEQCLDLKTGEIYYLNWRTGMRVSEDPRTNVVAEEEVYGDDNLYYPEEDDDNDDDDDDNNSYDSEATYSEELPSFSSSRAETTIPEINILTTEALRRAAPPSALAAPVLVLGGCKACLMYFMVPKEVDDCPRCGRQLLHFDQN
ncbi:hypothetical protein R3W88_000539 [Solanum pinnatisectum]|uniref:WW domain-containing protein n=1 Tax=Solanum pinnatisectum TaxID=50273 RepID=A0AAV9MJC4_9SOLN|nr:hypothetical protein R3W88_000539 [Solanum pinnatisectum]